MNNKTILVTGGSSGVGKTIIEHLASLNKVITLARRFDKLEYFFNSNGNISCYKADLSDLVALKKVLYKIDEQYSDISAIINCAGVMRSGMIEELTTGDFDYSIKVNAYAPIEIIKHFLPEMKRRNFGRIINITSGAPLNCFPNYSAYSASKSVLNVMTRTLSKEIENYNIKINLMSPGPVRSEMAPNAVMEPDICLPTLDYLLDDVVDTGKFYWLGYEIPLSPDLGNIDWLNAKGSDKLNKIFE